MRLKGTIRSMETWEHEGVGGTPADARDAAVIGQSAGFELVSVKTLPTQVGQPVRRLAVARSMETREIEADSDTYDDAEYRLRRNVPDGWQLIAIR